MKYPYNINYFMLIYLDISFYPLTVCLLMNLHKIRNKQKKG